ncbi:alpha/beta fold hydrolase [Alisedimentitalea sp. MJ-SS2]|uniref:alpha/beta hydrolase n=1 Tax=Aliisedimentitalea sp. MJ-SS2 TaxID=3049795 RepID=UPI002914720E|nr:alpha/beta fold hydrolase [Alisedimentitalea sp. MJ-SS2]MDU8926357.1 alpha/beta fold hydrolase [Alisedimentitalea sp. MJ-SS2]
MRVFGKWLGRFLLLIAVIGAGAWTFGPYVPVEVNVQFDERKFGEGVQVYFESVESQLDDITEGVEKRVVWAGGTEVKTDIAVLYVHGFSATSQELRPVPDRVAEEFGANLVFTRLRGHGRPGDALGEARVEDWMADVAEALAAARTVGREVIVIATSTGCTLVSEALLQPGMAEGVKAVAYVSPNFAINDDKAWILTLPGARYWVPLLAGRERAWEPSSDLVAKYWTSRYPMQAAITLAALVKHAAAQDYSAVSVPGLFYFSDGDTVVRAGETHRVAGQWGADHGGLATVEMLPDDAQVVDNRHVIAGYIASPDNTEATIQVILSWLEGL